MRSRKKPTASTEPFYWDPSMTLSAKMPCGQAKAERTGRKGASFGDWACGGINVSIRDKQ